MRSKEVMEGIRMNFKSMEELDVILGKSVSAWVKLFNYIRTKYVMDEFWNGKDELKLRRGGRTFATFYIREGYFSLLIIFGQKERSAFENMLQEFPQYIVDFYSNCRTYHDGKWMFFDIRDDQYDELHVDFSGHTLGLPSLDLERCSYSHSNERS